MRARLAQAWFCRPAEIDEIEDADEIGRQLALWDAETRYKPTPQPE